MFKVAYCDPVVYTKEHDYKEVCQMFVDTCKEFMPEYCKRLKTHLLLHLVDNIMDFGPTPCFNTERLIGFRYNGVKCYFIGTKLLILS